MRHKWTALPVMVLVLAQVGLNLAPATASTEPLVTTTRLRFELTTTSDWMRIRVEGATFPVTRTLVSDPLAPATFSGDAWTVVNHTAGTAHLVVDTITTELAGRPDFRVVVEQGRYGSSMAAVHDDRRGADPILSLSTGGGAPISTAQLLSRAELLGPAELLLPHADDRRLVLAAYYPWWQRTGNPTQKMAEQPLQPRSAWDLEDVRSHAAQARANGIDGFAVSWAGQTDNGRQLDLMLQAMTEQGGVAVPYLETPQARGLLGQVSTATVARWLDEALARSASPAFLRTADGVPVVMVFSMELLSADTWRAIAADSARRGRPVHLVGDADPATHGGALAGWHRYGASGTESQLTGLWQTMTQRLRGPHLLDPAAPITISMATVSPGYDDTKLRGTRNAITYRGANGERYEETWDAAVAADPDWVLITSWNEWYEGTSVEPGTVNGDLALRQTAARIAAWKGQPAPITTSVPPTTSTTVPPTTAPPSFSLLPFLPWHVPAGLGA
jgi:glycoprotein endo-alpha-1,2-mannosidase